MFLICNQTMETIITYSPQRLQSLALFSTLKTAIDSLDFDTLSTLKHLLIDFNVPSENWRTIESLHDSLLFYTLNAKSDTMSFEEKAERAKITKLLIEGGANINHLDFAGRLIEHDIIDYYGDHSLELIKALVARGVDINRRSGEKSDSMLHLAAANVNLEVAKFLIEKGADCNLPNSYAITPLHSTGLFLGYADHNPIKMAGFLLDCGANIEARDSMSRTPLMSFVRISVPMSKFLIERGANINARDIYGRTPLHEASSHGQLDLVEYLVSNAANPNAVDGGGRSARDVALTPRIAELLSPSRILSLSQAIEQTTGELSVE